MRFLLSAGIVFLSLCLGASAMAQEKDAVALIALEISGDGPPELRQQLQQHISEGLFAEGQTVTDLEQTLVLLKDTPELIGCSSTACLERIAEVLGAQRFVRAVVTASGATYELKLELLSTSEDQPVLNSVQDSCAVCTIAELNTLAADLARKLLLPNTDQRLSVRIATEPPGANIVIDGVEAGESPLDTTLKIGLHKVVATMEGHTSSEKKIEVQADGSDQQRFELLLPKIMIIERTKPEHYGVFKWGALGASGALLVLGGILVAIDGDPSCDDGSSSCPELRDTMTGGIISISGGVLMGAASGWMFWRESTTRPKKSLSVQATAGGAIGGYSFTF
jgi:hypothetical protein